MVAFTVGALLPLLTIVLVPAGARVAVTGVAVVLALAGTGWASAKLGSSAPGRAVVRNVCGGLLAMRRDLPHRQPRRHPDRLRRSGVIPCRHLWSEGSSLDT